MDPSPHLERFASYEQACREFRWLIPERINIATVVCRRHSDAVYRIALRDVKEGGINTYTYGGLDFLSDRFATALSESNIIRGDSVAVALPPSAGLAIAQLGVLKAGAVVVPLSTGWDPALVHYALSDSGAKALVVDESIYRALEPASRTFPNLSSRFVVRDLRPAAPNPGYKDFWSEVERCSSDFEAPETDANAAAFIFYGESQGTITGVVHSHRSVIGQFTAFEMFNNPEAGSVFWTAGDWSSPSEVMGVLYPALWYGCSVVAGASNDEAAVVRLLEQCEVSNILILSLGSAEPGSAGIHACFAGSNRERRAGMPALPGFSDSLQLKVRTIVAETLLSPEQLVSNNPDVTLNDVWGRPETGWIFGTCDRLFASAGSSVGRTVPGRAIAIIDNNGNPLPPRRAGQIAVHKSDPGLFTGYHGRIAASAGALFVGDWFLTGQAGYKNEDGGLHITPSPRVVGTE